MGQTVEQIAVIPEDHCI